MMKRRWKWKGLAGLLGASLLFGSATPSYALVLPVVDWSSIANLVVQARELLDQGKHLRAQAAVIQNQARSWKDMGAGDWLEFGSNAIDFAFQAEDIYRFASTDLAETFRASFPDATGWEGKRYPNADQIAMIIDQTNSVFHTNAVNGKQILRARDQVERVLRRARSSTSQAQLAGSQTELQAMQVDEAQRARALQMENNAMLASLNRQLAADLARKDDIQLKAEAQIEEMNNAVAEFFARSKASNDSLVNEIRRRP